MRNELIRSIEAIAKKNNIKVAITNSNMNKSLKELGVDSLSMLSLIIELEEQVGHQLPDAQLSTIKTLNQLLDAFEKNKKTPN